MKNKKFSSIVCQDWSTYTSVKQIKAKKRKLRQAVNLLLNKDVQNLQQTSFRMKSETVFSKKKSSTLSTSYNQKNIERRHQLTTDKKTDSLCSFDEQIAKQQPKLDHTQNIMQLKVQVHKGEKKLQKTKEELANVKMQYKDLQEELSNAKKQSKDLEEELSNEKKSYKEIENQLENAKNKCEVIEKDFSKEAKKLQKFKEKLSSERKKQKGLVNCVENIYTYKNVQELQSEIQKKNSILRQMRSEMRQKNLDLKALSLNKNIEAAKEKSAFVTISFKKKIKPGGNTSISGMPPQNTFRGGQPDKTTNLIKGGKSSNYENLINGLPSE